MKIGDVFSDEDFDRSRSGASLVAGQGVAPDQQAEAVKLGNRYGLHPDTARASLDELRQRADMEDRRKALDAAPGLRAWVAEKPQNAPLADLRDMEVMGTLERKLRSVGEGFGGQFVGSGVTGIGQSFDALQRRVIEGVASLVLPKPRAGGAVDPASLHGPLMGEGWRQLGQPVKDYWREAGVPAAQKDFADDVVSGLGQMLGQMGLTALNPPAGVAMMFGQGADTMADKTAKDPGTQKNRDLAILGSGAWTGATEWASNKFILGMEKLPGIKMLDLKTPAFSRAARIGLAAAEEGGQEFAENVGQDWMRQTLTNPNAPIDFGDAGYQAGVGATVGAIVRSMVEGALHIRGRQNRQVFEALREADPELRKRLPEAYRDFVAQQTEGGGIENVFVPAERFVEYFQGVGLDPRVVASAIGAKNFEEAVAAGSDIVIPTADFAVHVATGEHFNGLAPDLKLHQGDLTQRELDAMNASKAEREARLQAEFARMIEEGKQAQNINTAIESIVSDVEGQLVAAHMDPKAARDTAQVMRGAAVLASRAYPHLSPVEAAEKMWERYGLTVGRPMPDVLTKLKQADMSLDPMLNMIRAAQGPTESQINGPSLVEFLRNAGGLLPVGELLDAQQARTPPGKKSLIQDSGLSLDEAAMKAVEAGFFVGTENGQLTETQLVEAITREVLGGNPEFSAAMQDQKAMETARTLAELADVLDQAGVDLKAMDNQTARERLMQFSQGQVFEQRAKQAIAGDSLKRIEELTREARQLRELRAQAGKDGDAFERAHLRLLPIARELEQLTGHPLGLDDPATAVRFSGSDTFFTPERDLIDRAVSEFGVTRNPGEAGYILPDGRMLKFGEDGVRGEDHRAIARIGGLAEGYSDAMIDFMNRTGAVRVDFNSGLFEAQRVPTEAQMKTAIKAAKESGTGILAQASRPDGSQKADLDLSLPSVARLAAFFAEQANGREFFQQTYGNPAEHQTPLPEGTTEIDVDGVKRPALNSEGRPIHWSEEGTRNFWRGFGDSKVVDADGKPLVVYHGTTADFSVFDGAKSNSQAMTGVPDGAFVFSSSTVAAVSYAGRFDAQGWDTPENAAEFSRLFDAGKNKEASDFQRKHYGTTDTTYDSGANVVPAYLSVRNPLEVDARGGSWKAIPWRGGTANINALAKFAKAQGYDGLVVRNVRDQAVGVDNARPADTFFVFSPTQIKSATGNRGTFSAGDANILNQGPRGSLRIGSDRRMAITLTENANLSTFLHETGHFYLEMMGDLAEDPAADQQVKDDYTALLGWLGVKSRAEIAVEHHEKFARANEAYLMEGNAPAPELRGVFQRFKAWLVGVYRDIANLDVKLNDDVRAVFDRIYATDQEIDAAKREVDVSSLFLDAAAAGMTEAEFAAYAGQIERVSEEAQGTLMRRLMAEYQRGKEAWWKDERARTLEEVTAEVDAQPVYRAFAALVSGKMDDGTPVKLDRDDIGRRYGEGTLKQLPRGFQRIYASEGGMDIDTAAEMFGFPSGEAMLKSFLEMRPRKELIQAETDARMRERHGDLMTDGRIEEAARDALHSERRADVLATELRALNRKIREATPVVRFERQKAQQAQRENVAALDALPSPAMFRRAAAGMIDAMAVRDIRPHAYLLAGRKAAREAAAALARDQAGDAFSAKQRELLNHYLYLEAVKARNEADALRDYAKTFEGSRKREKLGKAGHDYLDQAEALLDRFEFSRISLTALQRRKSLREFIAEKEADGEIILIPEHLQDEARRINWREMSMGELRGLADALRNLDHLAGFKNKLMVKRKAMEFAAVKAELLASMEAAFQASTGDLDTFKENRTVGQTMNRFGRSLDGSLLKVEQLVEWMDGGRIDGPWARYFFDQADDAQAREYDLHKAVTARLMALADQMGPQWRASMMDKTEVVLPGIVGPLSRYRLISMALNTGNATNFQRLTQGMGWSEDQVRNALERLTAQDWTYVQGVWDTLETLWPDIAALQERVAGVPPPKVEAREVVTPHGTFRGGYFPLVYDPAKSNAGEKQANAAESVAQFMSQGYGRANTDRGATKARIENFAAPLMIDFEAVLTDHLPKVIKDISHREAALSLNKLLHDKEIKAALIDRIGLDRYQLLTGWEQTLIQDRADAFHRQFAAAHWSLSRLRANTSVVTMGWKVSTMFAQFAGFGPSWDLVGGKALTKGLMEFTAHPLKSLEMVAEKSGEMRHRMDTLDRDIKEALLATRGETGIVHAVRRTAFYLTGIADRMVSMPTWLGAYRKTLAENGGEENAIRAGDRAVRLSQGAGGAKDLAAVQRNTEIMKLVTMYYTPFSALYARMRDAGHSTRGVRDLPRLVARSIGLVILPAVLGELLAGRPPDDDEDPVAWAARKALLYPAASIPIFRDLVQWQLDPLLASLSGGNLQHQPGYKFTPIISAVEKLARMPGHAFDAMTGDRPWDDTAWEMLEGSGYLFGLPTAQPRITGEYLEDLFTGDASPETAAEMWHDLLFRRPPERAKR